MSAARRGPESVGVRLQRLLLVLPWLMERGSTPVSEVAERFGLTDDQVVRDITLASLCGLPPYVDEMLDVVVDEGMVWVGVPRIFTRPLALTAREGTALLVAVRAALALPGADPAGPLARAADKLAAALGRPALDVELDRPPMLGAVEQAVRDHERLAVTYYSASRDALTARTIEPLAVFADRGNWYVTADDDRSGQERHFRVDRLHECRPTGEHFTPRPVDPVIERGWFADGPSTEVVLWVTGEGRWVVETYPVVSVEADGDGLRVRLPVASERWLARLLLRLGPRARVLEPATLAGVGREAAVLVLTRYRAGAATSE